MTNIYIFLYIQIKCLRLVDLRETDLFGSKTLDLLAAFYFQMYPLLGCVRLTVFRNKNKRNSCYISLFKVTVKESRYLPGNRRTADNYISF